MNMNTPKINPKDLAKLAIEDLVVIAGTAEKLVTLCFKITGEVDPADYENWLTIERAISEKQGPLNTKLLAEYGIQW